MELLEQPVKLKNSKQTCYIHVFSDIHRSASGCDTRKLRSDINRIKHANEKGPDLHLWFGGGDWCNAIGPRDKRHDAAAISPEFRPYIGDDLFGRECSTLISEFRPIRDWGIGVGMGNHEASVAKYGEFNPTKRIAEALDLPYLGYSALIRFELSVPGRGSHMMGAYWHHGFGAAGTPGGKLNMLLKLQKIVATAQVYCVGHVHELIDLPKIRMGFARKGPLKLTAERVLYINSGTYQKGYATERSAQKAGKYNEPDPDDEIRPDYAEKKGYEPSIIGHNGWAMKLTNKSREKGYIIDLRRVDWR